MIGRYRERTTQLRLQIIDNNNNNINNNINNNNNNKNKNKQTTRRKQNRAKTAEYTPNPDPISTKFTEEFGDNDDDAVAVLDFVGLSFAFVFAVEE